MPSKGKYNGKYKSKPGPKENLTDYVPLGQMVSALKAWGCRTLQDANWTIFTNESKFGANDGKRLKTHVDFITMGELLKAHGDGAVADSLAMLVKQLFREAHELQPHLNVLDSLKATLKAWGLRYRAIGDEDERKGSCCAVSEDWSDILPARFSEDGLAKSKPDVARQAVAEFLSDVFKKLQPVAVGI